jgi:HlyD family secretion protein
LVRNTRMTVTIANSKSQLRLERRSLERPSEHAHSLKRHAWMGAAVIAVLVLGLGGWTATTQIAGAVVAGGTVVVDGGSKRVQHQEGGIVKKIFVKDDDKVAAGQLLVRLDDVAARTDLDVVLSQLRDAIGADSRLTAETTEAPSMVLPSIIGDWPSDPELAAVMGDQERLRQSRKKSLDSQASRLDEQIAAEQSQITGLKAQQVNEMKRSQASLEGQMGGIAASIAAAESSVSGLQMQRAQLYVDFRSQAISDLQAASQSVAELLQKKVAAEARLNRLDIRAPIAGTVHESIVQTVGGVVNASDTLMLIVPQDNHLLVDTRISPLDIDKVHLGQPVQVRLSGLDVRATPELTGNVKAISPDLTRDPATGVQYYSVRLDIPDSEQKKLPSTAKLVPGMPAEAFIQTGDRTVLSYLMRPLTEQLSHTFREQ